MMRGCIFAIVMALVLAVPATAGKNSSGALIVHTDDARMYYRSQCENFEDWVPQICEDLNTRTDMTPNYTSMIWFIAAFDESSSPGVSSIYFGNNHNLPEMYHNRWEYCGPAGTFENPDPGWPEDPDHAGNWVVFGSPIVGDRFFTFYRVDVWGFEGDYYGTGAHPAFGHARFLDDSIPPVADITQRFGLVRWYEPGYNVCPGVPLEEMLACCFGDEMCYHVTGPICADLGGQSLPLGTDCDPNPCPQGVLGVCCFEDGSCRIEAPLECAALGGDFIGVGGECDPNPCVQPPEGACCLNSGECLLRDVFDCDDLGGTYLGAGTDCDPNPCLGACCFLSNDCVIESLYACGVYGGEFQGAGSDCDPNPCPQYDEGACCLETGECMFLTEPLCAQHDAVFVNEATSCDPNPCYGACCFYYGCVMQTLYWCEPMGGEFMGAGSDCDPDPCGPTSGVPEAVVRETTWGGIKARYRE